MKDTNVIYAYTLKQAIEDWVLVEIFKNSWNELSGGKPIVATSHLFEEVSLAGLMEIWNEYVLWRTTVMPTLAEEMHLDIRSRVKMVEVVSIGTLTSSLGHPRETFRRAIIEGKRPPLLLPTIIHRVSAIRRMRMQK